MKNVKSAYIHIPFCTNICSYCDFAKTLYNEKTVSRYLDMLEEAFEEKLSKLGGKIEKVDDEKQEQKFKLRVG